MAQLLYSIVKDGKLLDEFDVFNSDEYQNKFTVSTFIRKMQAYNNRKSAKGSTVRFVWKFDYGLTEHQIEQQRQAKLNSGVVYYICSGTDCDGVRYAESCKYDNQLKAEQQQEHAYEWADGPMQFTQITEAEYEQHTNWSHDTFAEAAGY